MALRRSEILVLIFALISLLIATDDYHGNNVFSNFKIFHSNSQQQHDIANQKHIPIFINQDTVNKNTRHRNNVLPLPLPLPLLTDLDGDGAAELIVPTRTPSIQIINFNNKNKNNNNINNNNNNNQDSFEIKFQTSFDQTKHNNQIVSLASGSFSSFPSSSSSVVVVVTASFHILCFNSELRLLWHHVVDVDLTQYTLTEVVVIIAPVQLRQNDTAAVIVGGRLQEKTSIDTKSRTRYNRNGEDDEGEEGEAELTREAQRFHDNNAHSAEAEAEAEVDSDTGSETLLNDGSPVHSSSSSHMNYYAFNSEGVPRWENVIDHQTESDTDSQTVNDLLHPQHSPSYASSSSSSSSSWKTFLNDMLNQLPHQWRGRFDSYARLAHFDKAHNTRRRSNTKSRKHKITANQYTETHEEGHVFNRHQSDKTHTQHVAPNTIVLHLSDGIHVLHLYSGRPICSLALSPYDAHLDMNGDGIIEHVKSATNNYQVGMTTEEIAQYLENQNTWTKKQKENRCRAKVTAGVPIAHDLFNVSICSHGFAHSLHNLFVRSAVGVGDAGADEGDLNSLLAYPLVIPDRPSTQSSIRLKWLSRRKKMKQKKKKSKNEISTENSDKKMTVRSESSRPTRTWSALFYIDKGTVSKFNMDGRAHSSVSTEATFSSLYADSSSPSSSSFSPLSPSSRSRSSFSSSSSLSSSSLFFPSLSFYHLSSIHADDDDDDAVNNNNNNNDHNNKHVVHSHSSSSVSVSVPVTVGSSLSLSPSHVLVVGLDKISILKQSTASVSLPMLPSIQNKHTTNPSLPSASSSSSLPEAASVSASASGLSLFHALASMSSMSISHTLSLPAGCIPVLPPVTGDLNSAVDDDDTNDIVIVTTCGVHVYMIALQTPIDHANIIIIVLIFMLAGVFVLKMENTKDKRHAPGFEVAQRKGKLKA